MIIVTVWSDTWNVSYIELRIWNQVSYDLHSYERNYVKQLRIEAWKSQDFNWVWTCACLLQDLLGTQLCKAVVSKNNLVSVDLSKHSCFLIEKTTNQTEPQETR